MRTAERIIGGNTAWGHKKLQHLMEVRRIEYFSMAQARHAMVSRRSLPEVPHAHFVCP
jgi:hypothetical protein